MSFFERFRSPSRVKQESADQGLTTAKAKLEDSLVEAENLDLLREREELSVELEMQGISSEKDEGRAKEITQRIQEIDALIQNEKNTRRAPESNLSI